MFQFQHYLTPSWNIGLVKRRKILIAIHHSCLRMNATMKNPIMCYDYNFYTGHPYDDELPVQQMNELFHQLSISSSSWNQQCLQYGNSSGDVTVRQEIGNFVSRQCCHDDIMIGNDNDDNDDDALIFDGGDSNDNDHSNDKDIQNWNRLDNVNHIFCTTGISHGIDLIISCLSSSLSIQPGDIVYVEKPTYFLVSQIFRNHGCTIRYLPQREPQTSFPKCDDYAKNNDCFTQQPTSSSYCTFDIDLLKDQLEQYQKNQQKHLIPKIIYIIPTHHNPTGYTMSINDRYQLVQLCAQYRIVLIADEVYHLLDWSTHKDKGINNIKQSYRKPARMAAIYRRIKQTNHKTIINNDHADNDININDIDDDNDAMIISLWALTKIWCPGIRFGWIECSNRKLHQQLRSYGYIASAGSCNPFVGEICHHLFKQRIIDQYLLHQLIPSYQQKCDIVCQAIHQYNHQQRLQSRPSNYPMILHVMVHPTGGYFIWLRLPNSINAKEFLDYCHQKTNTNRNHNDKNSNHNHDDKDLHLTKSIHFMLGTRCDPISSNMAEQQQYQGSYTDDLSSYIRLCFVNMDIIKLRDGISIFLQKFRHYCLMNQLPSET